MKSRSRNAWMLVSSLFWIFGILGTLGFVEWFSITAYRVPSPEVVFLGIVVFTSLIKGRCLGLVSAGMTFLYSLHYFSVDGQFMHYTHENWIKVVLLNATTFLVALLSGVKRTHFQQKSHDGTQETETYFQELVQGLDVIVWKANLSTSRFTFVSHNAEAMLGYPVRQWLDEVDFWTKHIHPEDRDHAVTFRQAAIADGKNHDDEYRMKTTNGEIVWIRDQMQLLRDATGQVREIRGVMVNITERKQSEDASREFVRRFRETLENIRLLVVELDLEGKITLCNDYLLTQTGWRRQEIMGKDWFDTFLPKDSREEIRNLFMRGIAQGKIHAHDESDIITQTGERRSISWNNGFLKDSNGKIIGTISLGDDVTEQKRIQEKIRQSQKMEAIGRLTGGIVHDFNNLLTAIIGYSALLLAKLAPDDPFQKNVDEIRKAAERAAVLTRQLLIFSRKQVLELQVLDLNSVVTNTSKFLHRLIGEDINLELQLGSDLGHIKADPGQIEQVLMNLVVNARDAMAYGGKLTIQTANVDLDESHNPHHWKIKPGRYVMLAVSDTGCGMDAEVKSHLFEPFFTTKEVGKGTGLGLPTIYGIVRQSGGSIDILSEPGQGTTFKVYLPVIEGTPQDTPTVQKPVLLTYGSETVLVVEDEPRVRKLICDVLIMNGYQVLEATQPQEALQVSEQYHSDIHLMVTDVVMPGMNGYELAAQIIKIRPETKLLYVSGYVGSNIVQDGVVKPKGTFLQKPFTPDLLLRKVRELLDLLPSTPQNTPS